MLVVLDGMLEWGWQRLLGCKIEGEGGGGSRDGVGGGGVYLGGSGEL